MNAKAWYRAIALFVMVVLFLTGQASPSAVASSTVDEHSLPYEGMAAMENSANWRGEYFSNMYLSGNPTVVRYDRAIDFDWGMGSPDPALPSNYFSVRWTADIYFPAGYYRFTTETDDGVRLFIDHDLLIDEWREQSVRQFTADVQLSAGVYSVRVEYFDMTRDAIARLWWQRFDSDSGWRAEYFNNMTLTPGPVLVRHEPAIDFNWGDGSPLPGIVHNDEFSARWARTITVSPGTYRFTVTCDDGMRIWVDGQLLLDEWHVHAATTYTREIYLDARPHTINVEYFEARGVAIARVEWAAVSPVVITSWKGEYYNNPWLYGTPVLVRDDPAIDFDWKSGSPDWRIPGDRFSVRWTRSYDFVPGSYRFTVRTDDGVRLYVDDRLLIDRWYDMAPQSFSTEIALGGGRHTIRMEYYENQGNASAWLGWEIIPRERWVGNIVTQVPCFPSYSWIKVYRLEPDGTWLDVNPHGYASIEPSGWLKIDGLWVDYARYGDAGHPYRVEQWVEGRLAQSVGDTGRGEAPFRVYVGQDSVTPWHCEHK